MGPHCDAPELGMPRKDGFPVLSLKPGSKCPCQDFLGRGYDLLKLVGGDEACRHKGARRFCATCWPRVRLCQVELNFMLDTGLTTFSRQVDRENVTDEVIEFEDRRLGRVVSS